ncbi:hypothetical protein [Edaphovirga cremea]
MDKLGVKSWINGAAPIVAGVAGLSISSVPNWYIFSKVDQLPVY